MHLYVFCHKKQQSGTGMTEYMFPHPVLVGGSVIPIQRFYFSTAVFSYSRNRQHWCALLVVGKSATPPQQFPVVGYMQTSRLKTLKALLYYTRPFKNNQNQSEVAVISKGFYSFSFAVKFRLGWPAMPSSHWDLTTFKSLGSCIQPTFSAAVLLAPNIYILCSHLSH